MSKKKKKVDKYHRHELLDRASLVLDMIDESIYHHPAISEEMLEHLDKAMGIIYQHVYCRAAGDHCRKCGKCALIPHEKKANTDYCLECSHKQKRKS